MAKNVLIVDDAAFMRMMLKDILTKNGYNVVGEDITMPEKDGIAALKEIKAFDSNAVCVMCSAMGQQAMVIESIQAGAKDFIVKPFQADRVVEAVRKVIGA